MPRKAKKKLPSDFETALESLENLVQQMEAGDMSLEDSLKAFEEGIQLTQICQGNLDTATQRIMQLNPNGSSAVFEQETP
jgi:exodeoxyribonuclease VII small subunit